MSFLAAVPIFDKVLDIVDQFVPDKDKAMEIKAELRKIELSTMESLLKTQTTPWVDALVKLLYASVTLVRPLVSTGLFVYGLMNPETFQVLSEASPIAGDIAASATFGALPAWGVSRHMEKKRKEEGPWVH